MSSDFRVIPSIEQLRQRPAGRDLESRYGATSTLAALRAGAAALRDDLAAGRASAASGESAAAQIEAFALMRLHEEFRPSLVPVINATGVALHTNLGRAPLSLLAAQRVALVAGSYSTLEYDLERGGRGRRDVHAEALLCRVTGAEAAAVVNNNAAATLLVLAALGAGREVIVSRGELVEIGGGFRVPDVMAQSGAILREVGTTNKTRTADYAAAIGEPTALILRVHPSNFRVQGFTERAPLADLAALAHRFSLPLVEDLGSGHLADAPGHPLAGLEPSVAASLEAGVDVCCFSGDKLLGGPQAGLIVGRTALVEPVRRHPLMRALRVDKMTYAALEATLAEYAADRARTTVPVQRMLSATADDIFRRAEALASTLREANLWRIDVIQGSSAVGGGSAPGVALPTWLVAIGKDAFTADALERRLRGLDPPVIARIEHDRVVLDLRTVLPHQDVTLASLLRGL